MKLLSLFRPAAFGSCFRAVWLLVLFCLAGSSFRLAAQPVRFGTSIPNRLDQSPAARPQGPGDEHWQDGFDIPQVAGTVYALLSAPNGDVIVGGSFGASSYGAGGVPNTLNVARWTGQRWQAIGVGIPDVVTGLAQLPNGDLVAAALTSTGTAYLAVWNGAFWRQINPTLNGTITKLAVTATGDVLVAGTFTNAGGNLWADYLARWDGTAWQSIGGIALNAPVNDLVVTAAGHILVGGAFTDAGGVFTADHIARWDGVAWQPLGAGLPDPTTALLLASNGDVVAAQAASAGPTVMRFNGTSWQTMTTPLSTFGNSPGIRCLAFLPTGELVAGGNFLVTSNLPGRGLARWDGAAWQPLAEAFSLLSVNALLMIAGGQLLAGGSLLSPGFRVILSGLFRYNGTGWYALGGGLGNSNFGYSANNVLVLPNGEIIVSGFFSSAGSDPALRNIARWTATGWQALGTELSAFSGVPAVVRLPNGDLLASASTLGSTVTTQLWRWNGATWQAFAPILNGAIWTMAVASNGDIVAGGGFTDAGGDPAADYVARWTGTSWQAIGGGLNGEVNSVALSPAGQVVVGGYFLNGGGNSAADGIARWDGTAWQPFGAGLDSAVTALAYTPGGDLLATGYFEDAGGNPAADRIARWDGAAWQPLGTGLNRAPWALAVAPNGDVVTSGYFTDAGGNPAADRIARWDGAAWQSLGTGLNGPAWSVAFGANDVIVAAGAFNRVGDGSKPTSQFAIYNTHLTGRAEEIAAAPLSLYPNPAHTTVRLREVPTGSAAVQLLDGLGRVVRVWPLVAGATQAELSLAGLSPGFYLVRAGGATRRLMVE